MKNKVLAIITSLILIINMLPMSTAVADAEYVEVTENSAPIRNDYYDTGDVLQWVSRGTMLRVIDSKRNLYLNKWYEVQYDTGYSCIRGWIYSGDVSEHSHEYQRFSYNGNTFGICTKCKTVSMERVTTVRSSQADALVAAIPTAGGLAAADGPLPVGEIAGLIVLGIAYLEIGNTVSSTVVREWIDSVSLDEIMRELDSCSPQSFYRVSRTANGLVKKDGECLSVLQAFLESRFNRTDVWTIDKDAAETCAKLNFGRFFGPERDSKDCETKYYHFHYGTSHKNKDASTHVFYGTTDNGETPGLY